MSTYYRPRTVVSHLAQQVSSWRDRIALEASGIEYTYAELDSQSTSLARYLVDELDVRRGDRVGLCLDPSFNMIVGLLAILKSGAAYVPIDAKLPRSRIVYVIKNSRMHVVITEKKFDIELSLCCAQAESGRVEVLGTDRRWQPSHELPRAELELPDEDALAYLIYTSGSTGEPKGVMIEHRGLLNLGLANVELFGVDSGTRLLQFASLSFDAATWEIFTAIVGGATLVLGTREELMPGRILARFLRQHRITMLCLPPSLLALMDEDRGSLDCVDTVVVAGEACPPATARAWSSDTRRMFNAYGPTEATVCATTYQILGTEESVPIGAPLPGVTLEIVDEWMRRVPTGTVGELCIGGIGVARGYLNKRELTARSFVPNQWGEGRLYRTGDLVVVDPVTGFIEFIGRKDNRIKVRGFRVELEAIERTLCEHPGILAAAVGTTETRKEGAATINALVGYYVARPGSSFDSPATAGLREFLCARLPEYMVPHVYVQLDALPMMPNGSKVDRAALPAPRTQLAVADDCAEEESSPAQQIARIYEHTLLSERGAFAPDTDFFEQGGTSLDAAEALVSIEKHFEVRIPSRKMYEYSTPADMAALIAGWGDSQGSMEDKASELRKDAQLGFEIDGGGTGQRNLPQAVLITGATGFLGVFLVYKLIKQAPGMNINCLIRAQSFGHAVERLRQTCSKYGFSTDLVDQLNVVVGDIEGEILGLTESAYQVLAREVDTVYHCAADISYVKPYSVMRGPNVVGTRNLLRFATSSRTKVFHYVSTAAVFGATGTLADLDTVDEKFDIDRSIDLMSIENGYTQSKWAAERLVRTASEHGLPVSIYRPGFIQGDSQNGAANTSDLLCRLICGCIQMRSYPDFPDKYWLPISVDVTADAIAHISMHGKPGVYHLSPARIAEVSHNELFQIVNYFGFAIEPIAPDLWFQRLARIDSANALFPIASYLLERVYQGRNTVMEVHHRTSACDNSEARAALEGSEIEIPDFGAAAIKQQLDYLVMKGLIDNPPHQGDQVAAIGTTPPTAVTTPTCGNRDASGFVDVQCLR